jgi:hypothetical protein
MLFRVVFWDILPCKIIVARRFRGANCHHHPGGSTYLWNVGRQSFYTAVYPRRQLWTSGDFSSDLTLSDFFLWGYYKDTVYSTNPWSLGNWDTILNRQLPTLTHKHFAVCTRCSKKGVCLSLRSWTFSASTVKLFCKLFLADKDKKTLLSHYIDITKAYKYCCNQG